MPAFLTVEELKAYPLPVKEAMWDKITDEQVEKVIGYASQNIEDYLDRQMSSAYYTEIIPGNGRDFIILENRPVTAVLGISARDFIGNTRTYDEQDVLIESDAGIVRWINQSRWAFFKNQWWSIYYRAGYTTIPGPVVHATALQAVSMLQPMFRGGTNFVEVDLIEGINETIVDLLEKYKNKRIG